jgi:NADPH-dependent glutamate synthase beta subunit-like oxidoreductase
MDFLSANTKSLLDSTFSDRKFIDVRGKNVLVIGGGDTGTDCVGSSLRHGCRSLVQFEVTDRPMNKILTHDTWLGRARTFQTDYGQEESLAVFGNDPREFNILTKSFTGDEYGNVIGVETIRAEWDQSRKLREVAGTEKFWPADVIFLAMGFTGIEKSPLIEDLGIALSDRMTIQINERKQTSVPKIFAAGDCERGQSLIVWAIADGRRAALSVDEYLTDLS